MIRGGVDTGWTFYTPYSSMYSNSYVVATGVGVFITGFSSILTGLNFIVTMHRMRAPGLTWFRLPLFVWAHYATSLVMILGHAGHRDHRAAGGARARPALGIFDPTRGGDPVLFQHLFWFYSHPAVYIMICRPWACRRADRRLRAQARLRLQVRGVLEPGDRVLGFLVWGHHMFVSGQSVYAGSVSR
jgi:cytochrome c oxidase subunit 1